MRRFRRWLKRMILDWSLALAVAGACLWCSACAPLQTTPHDDPCAAEIVRLEGERDAEVIAACGGKTFDACEAVPVIDRRYDPLIQAQVECKR